MSQHEEESARHRVRTPIRGEGTARFTPALASQLDKAERRLSVMSSRFGGYGCFATVLFQKGSAIAEYAGERITRKEAVRRMKGRKGKRISELDADCYIDGSINGNETQYINHSCEPNADALIIDGLIILFALRKIVPGEEITVDYLNSFEEDRSVCHCRTASCRQRTTHQKLRKEPGQ